MKSYLFVPAVALALCLASCDSEGPVSTTDESRDAIASKNDKNDKVLLCHNAVDVDDPEMLVELIEVPVSTAPKHVEQHGDCVCDADMAVALELQFCEAASCDSPLDEDDDRIADGCDTEAIEDADGDGVADATDNCPAVSNADQSNTDGDAFGNACDDDDDNDGVLDIVDSCPLEYGLPEDGCAPPNLCPCWNGAELVQWTAENTAGYTASCVEYSIPAIFIGSSGEDKHFAVFRPSDGLYNCGRTDGFFGIAYPQSPEDALNCVKEIADRCAAIGSTVTPWWIYDADSDGVEDAYDNCPSVSNTDQTDTDGDDIGDACDDDDDNDEVADDVDACPFVFGTGLDGCPVCPCWDVAELLEWTAENTAGYTASCVEYSIPAIFIGSSGEDKHFAVFRPSDSLYSCGRTEGFFGIAYPQTPEDALICVKEIADRCAAIGSPVTPWWPTTE